MPAEPARNRRPSPKEQRRSPQEQAHVLFKEQQLQAQRVFKDVQARGGKKIVDEHQGGGADGKKGDAGRGPAGSKLGAGGGNANKTDPEKAKKAAEFAQKLAKKSLAKKPVPRLEVAPEILPEVAKAAGKEATDGGMAAEGGGSDSPPAPPPPTASSGGGGGPPAAVPTSKGGGGAPAAADTKGLSKDLVKTSPTEFAEDIKVRGSELTKAADKDEKDAKKKLPEFKAKMPGEKKAEGAKTLKKPTTKKDLKKGGKGANAKVLKLNKQQAVKGKKSDMRKDFNKLQKDTPAAAKIQMFEAQAAKISTKSTANTDPGPAPKVTLSGDSDPGRAGSQSSDADTKIADAEAQHRQAIDDGPGPEQVQRQELEETFDAKVGEMPTITEVPEDPKMADYLSKGHDKGVYDQADNIMKPEFDAHLQKADAELTQALDDREKDREKAVADTEKTIDDENLKAQDAQEAEITRARGEIDKGQKDTKKKQTQELKKAKGKSSVAKKKAEKDIKARRKADDGKIKGKYAGAKKKAAAKKQQAERKAAVQKKRAEDKKKDQSWWERAASAVSSFLDKVCSLVGQIFDTLSTVVSGILNAVKDAACAIVDAAVAFAAKALDVLGDMLKKMVTGLLGSIFPGLAKALNELIDKAVDMAKSAVKAFGEGLKKMVTAAMDALNKVVQAVINAYKVAIQTALTIASAVVSGDWEKALLALLEGALKLAGIAPDAFYALVGKGTDTIKKIVSDPGTFVGNLIKAVGQGFSQFAGNFLTHLKNGLIGWLTGQIGESGLELPKEWNAKGVLDLVLQIIGVTKASMKAKVEKKIGKKNMKLLETVWGYVEAAIEGGIEGLWEHMKDQLGNLWQTVLDGVQSFLMEKIVMAAVTKIASMFNPVGAIVQAILTVWNVYKFIKEQAAKIMALVTSVVDSMAAIVAGQIGGAANKVESTLAKGVPIAISFLANLLGLGGIAKKVKEIIGTLQKKVSDGIDKVIDKMWELGKKAFEALTGKGDKKKEDGKEKDKEKSDLPPPTKFSARGEGHKVWLEDQGGKPTVMVASTKMTFEKRAAYWRKQMKQLTPVGKAAAEAALQKAEPLQAKAELMATQGKPAADIAVVQQSLDDHLAELFKHVPSDPDLHKERVEYEKKLGVLTMNNGTAKAVGSEMVKNAHKYLDARSKLYKDPGKDAGETLIAMIKKISPKKESVWTGRLNKKVADIEQVFKGEPAVSSLTEMIVHAENMVQNIMIKDFLKLDGRKFGELMTKADLDRKGITDHSRAVLARWNRRNPTKTAAIKKDLTVWPSDYDDSKPNMIGEFDSKSMKQQRPMRENSEKQGATKEDWWSKTTVADFEAMDGVLSLTEKTLVSRDDATKKLPWAEGKLQWLLDSTDETVQKMNKKSVPLGAGVSGSTQRLFKECKMLNVSGAKRIRLAAVGWLLLLHHSFEEIMIACANNGAGAYGGNADYLALDPPGRGALEGIGPIPGAASPRP